MVAKPSAVSSVTSSLADEFTNNSSLSRFQLLSKQKTRHNVRFHHVAGELSQLKNPPSRSEVLVARANNYNFDGKLFRFVLIKKKFSRNSHQCEERRKRKSRHKESHESILDD
jgi:hypothetical protein